MTLLCNLPYPPSLFHPFYFFVHRTTRCRGHLKFSTLPPSRMCKTLLGVYANLASIRVLRSPGIVSMLLLRGFFDYYSSPFSTGIPSTPIAHPWLQLHNHPCLPVGFLLFLSIEAALLCLQVFPRLPSPHA